MTYELPNHYHVDPVYAASNRFKNTISFRDALHSRKRGNVTITPEAGSIFSLETDEKANRNGLHFTPDEECEISRPGTVVADYKEEAEFGARIDFENPTGLAAHIVSRADKSLPMNVTLNLLGGAPSIDRGLVLQRGISLS